jgi:hypothetical protein
MYDLDILNNFKGIDLDVLLLTKNDLDIPLFGRILIECVNFILSN